MQLTTPYYLIDESRMLPALEKIRYVERHSGTKSVLALKCFASFCAFPFMRRYLAGATSSSVYEAKLGHDEFGGETHGYSVAYTADELEETVRYCNKVTFNSLSQLERFRHHTKQVSVGLRLNPEFGHSEYQLSNPAAQYSRLGVRARQLPTDVAQHVSGAMTHINCENTDFDSFCRQLDAIEDRFARLLPQLQWFSLGGGISFTDVNYPLDDFCRRLATFAIKHSLQLYLEPGEAAVTNSASLGVTVLDIVHNDVPTLVVDAGVETHLLDVLTYRFTPELQGAEALPRHCATLVDKPGHVYRVCGRTCLAGDLFGNYRFAHPVHVGEQLLFTNVAGYSIVKKNYFNGIKMPAIYHKSIEGVLRQVTHPCYEDFRSALS